MRKHLLLVCVLALTVSFSPRDPIPPGANGEINVSFNSTGKSGIQSKPVTLVNNALNPEDNTIAFTMNVIDKKPQ